MSLAGGLRSASQDEVKMRSAKKTAQAGTIILPASNTA